MGPGVRASVRSWAAALPRNVVQVLLSVGVAVLALEAILLLAVPRLPTAPVAVAVRSAVVPGTAEPAGVVQDAASSARPGSCESSYHAIFRSPDGVRRCALNPTALLAHWGPPGESWLRSRGGEWRVEETDLTPGEACACLDANREREAARPDAGRPITVLTFEEQRVAIDAWVCADACTDAPPGLGAERGR